MDWNTIVNFLLIAGVIQGFVFNLVTLFFRKKFSIVILYLNLTVLFISLNNLQAWLRDNGYSLDLFYVKNLYVPWYLLILPMFYAFLIHFLRVHNKIKGFVKLSLIIFAVEFVLRSGVIAYVYYYVEGRPIEYIDTYTIIEDVFNLIFSLFIFYKACVLVFRREKTYKIMLSYDDLNWIKLFLVIGSVLMMLWTLAKVMDIAQGIKWGYSLLRLGTSLLLYWIGYQGLYRYNVVQDRIMLRKDIAKSEKFIDISSTPNPEMNEKHQREFEKYHQYIINNKRFLDPDLTMNSLSTELGVSVSHLSKLINSYSGYNFSDYVNSLRVEQAKRFLADPDFNHYTIVSIGLECGFNSRSTFYAAFKKFTLQTPTEYQDEIHVI